MTISILLADDQPMLRLGFRLVLDAQDDMLWSARRATGPLRCGWWRPSIRTWC